MNKVMLIVFLACISWSIVWAVDAPTTNPVTKLPSVKVNLKDGAEMVLIPAGEFLMGTSEEQLARWLKISPTSKREWFNNEMPQRKIELDTYYIYKTEVTVAQYRKFCNVTGREMPVEPSWKWHDNDPIVNVSWVDAKAYADWADVILPTEAQWEKAARSDDGRVYPWGNDWDADKCANWTNSDGKNGHIKGTHPVGSYPAGDSPYGIHDMAGNVWEWCADWYDENIYKTGSIKNPTGPKAGDSRVIKGGPWNCDVDGNYSGINRSVNRDYNSPELYGNNLGFRCAVLPTVKPTVATTTKKVVTKINPKDSAEMLLIPAGEFLMGTSEEQLTALLASKPNYKRDMIISELPQHKVYLDNYYMYKTEVTVAQFRKFCDATKREMPKEPTWKWNDAHPMVNVTWDDAKAYADWAGVILPTEAQWEKAARSDDGRIYPWGNDWDAEKCANWATSDGQNGNVKNTHKVGSFSTGVSPYGVMDMAGNVWEWCSDWYDADYYKISPVKNPKGPVTGNLRVLRSGSWNYKDSGCFRTTYRENDFPNNSQSITGFRCASPGP